METAGKAAVESAGEVSKEKTGHLLDKLAEATETANLWKGRVEGAFYDVSELARYLDEYKEDEIQDMIVISKLFRKQKLTS